MDRGAIRILCEDPMDRGAIRIGRIHGTAGLVAFFVWCRNLVVILVCCLYMYSRLPLL